MKLRKITLLICLCTAQPLFADTLDKTVARTLLSNPDVKEVFYRYKSLDQAHEQAKGGWLPTVDFTASYGVGKEETPTSRLLHDGSVTTKGTEANLTLRQLLFDGQFTNKEIDRTKAEAEAEYWNLVSRAENTALQVTQVYLDVLKTQRLKQLADDNLTAHETVYQQIKLRTDSGLGTLSDLSQIRGRVARAQANVLSASNNLIDAQAKYFRVVGEAPENLVEPSINASNIPATQSALLAKAEKDHPTLKSAVFDINAAQYQLERQKSNYKPNVALELVGSHSDDRMLSDQHINEVKVQLVFNYNLYNGGRDKEAEQEFAYKHQEAQEVRNKSLRQVYEGARLAWSARETLSKQIEFLNEHVNQSLLTKNAYREQFELARRSLLDLLDSENELFEAQRTLIAAEKDYQLAQFRVLNAMGMLLDSMKVDFDSINKTQY